MLETQPLLGGPIKDSAKTVLIVASVVALVVGVIIVKTFKEVGILHSLSGPLAVDERHVVDATLLAINEINEAGGLLGHHLKVVLRDGFSDEKVFASEMQRMLTQDKVDVVFGCWTSGSRKAVLPALASNNGLLFYPVQYEGVESHPNVVYTGAAPNQQILPAVQWAYQQGFRKFALIGSDYIFPRTANAIVKDALSTLGGVTINEQYLILGEEDPTRVNAAVANIKTFAPDVILNTVNGDTNMLLFNAFTSSAVSGAVISFSVAEPEVVQIMASGVSMAGSYASWNYFQSDTSAANNAFVTEFKNTYGQASVIGDPMAAAYTGVYLWAAAVKKANSFVHADVKAALPTVSVNSPMGQVTVSATNQHTVKSWYLGRVQASGQFAIVASSSSTINPDPYPLAGARQTQTAWSNFLNCWNRKWGMWKNGAGPSAILPNDAC